MFGNANLFLKIYILLVWGGEHFLIKVLIIKGNYQHFLLICKNLENPQFSQNAKFRTLGQTFLGGFSFLSLWWVVVYEPILVFSFDFGQAEQYADPRGL
jgi:hypothetical protein